MTDPAVRIREAFRYVTLGLMEWQNPPELTPRQYRRLEAVPEPRSLPDRDKQTHYGHAAYVDPFNAEADWEERA